MGLHSTARMLLCKPSCASRAPPPTAVRARSPKRTTSRKRLARARCTTRVEHRSSRLAPPEQQSSFPENQRKDGRSVYVRGRNPGTAECTKFVLAATDWLAATLSGKPSFQSRAARRDGPQKAVLGHLCTSRGRVGTTQSLAWLSVRGAGGTSAAVCSGTASAPTAIVGVASRGRSVRRDASPAGRLVSFRCR